MKPTSQNLCVSWPGPQTNPPCDRQERVSFALRSACPRTDAPKSQSQQAWQRFVDTLVDAQVWIHLPKVWANPVVRADQSWSPTRNQTALHMSDTDSRSK